MAATYDSCFRVRYSKRVQYDEDELSVEGTSEIVDLGLSDRGTGPRSRKHDAEVAWCPLAARLRHLQTGQPVTLAGSPMMRNGAKVSALAALADDIRALDDTLSASSSPAKSGVQDDKAAEQRAEAPQSDAPLLIRRNSPQEVEFDL
jgi:hypothetical protein